MSYDQHLSREILGLTCGFSELRKHFGCAKYFSSLPSIAFWRRKILLCPEMFPEFRERRARSIFRFVQVSVLPIINMSFTSSITRNDTIDSYCNECMIHEWYQRYINIGLIRNVFVSLLSWLKRWWTMARMCQYYRAFRFAFRHRIQLIAHQEADVMSCQNYDC